MQQIKMQLFECFQRSPKRIWRLSVRIPHLTTVMFYILNRIHFKLNESKLTSELVYVSFHSGRFI